MVPLLLLGLLVGVSLVAVHERWLLLLLGVAACVTCLAGLPPRWWARPPFVLGVAVAVGLGATPRPEGDYLVGSDLQGYVVLGLCVALVLASLLTLARPRPQDEPRPGVGPLS